MLVAIVCGFLFGFLGSMPLAGPVAVLVVSQGVRRQYRHAFRIAVGAAVAESMYALVAFIGFSAFIGRHSLFIPISRGVAAVILISLGVRFALWKDADSEPGPAREKPGASSFLLGFSITALNPTLLATWGAATAALFGSGIGAFTSWMAAPFALAAGIGIVSWFAVVLTLLRRFGEHFPQRAMTWIVRAMGVMLVCIGTWFVVRLVSAIRHPERAYVAK